MGQELRIRDTHPRAVPQLEALEKVLAAIRATLPAAAESWPAQRAERGGFGIPVDRKASPRRKTNFAT